MITTVGQAAFPLQTVVKTVEQLIQRGHGDAKATGPSAADIARRAAESVNEDQRLRRARRVGGTESRQLVPGHGRVRGHRARAGARRVRCGRPEEGCRGYSA